MRLLTGVMLSGIGIPIGAIAGALSGALVGGAICGGVGLWLGRTLDRQISRQYLVQGVQPQLQAMRTLARHSVVAILGEIATMAGIRPRQSD